MKKKSKRCIVPLTLMALLLSGCGEQATAGTNQDRIQSVKQVNSKVITQTLRASKEELFEIRKGTLVKYQGEYEQTGEIILPKEVRRIGKRAFQLSKELRQQPIGLLATQKLFIPADVTMEEDAFYGAGPLDITLEEGRECVEKRAFRDCTHYHSRIHVKVPDSVKVVCQEAFCSSGGWLTVELGKGVESLRKYALQGAKCDKLPTSLREIGSHALGEWGSIPNGLPEGVRYIERHCIDLIYGKIKIPASVRNIAIGAVEWEEGAEEIGYEVSPDNKNYRSDQNGWLYSKDGKTLYFAYPLDIGEGIRIPHSVKKVYRKGLMTENNGDMPKGEKIKIYGLNRVKIMD